MASNFQPYGIGIVRPFARTPQGDFASDGGQALLASNVGQILGTIPGELRWAPSFGTNLANLRQRLNTGALGDLARVSVESSIRRWEPRVNLTDVTVDPLILGKTNEIDLAVYWSAGEGRVSGVRLSA